MNLQIYVDKQTLLAEYQNTLQKIEVTQSKYGGYDYSPLEYRNQHDDVSKKIEKLQQDIFEIEMRMIEEIPTIQEYIRNKNKMIEAYISIENDLTKIISMYERLVGMSSEKPDERLLEEDGTYNDIFTSFEDYVDFMEWLYKDKISDLSSKIKKDKKYIQEIAKLVDNIK